MPNTVIALKKSATPGAAPADLANGEIAINYADGRFYYKRANGTIAFISSVPQADSFGSVNANGTLVLADTPGAVLNLFAGNNISITANALTDTITFSAIVNVNAVSDSAAAAFNQANIARTHANAAHLTANAAFDNANAAFLQANTARTHANAAFDQANTARNQANTALTTGQAAFGQANTANITADLAYGQANTGRTHANAAHLTANAAFDQANTARTHANSAFGQANTARDQANTALTTGQAAFSRANSALQNATGTFAGTLTTTGQIIANAKVTVTATDGSLEGGEVELAGSGSYDTKSIDSYGNDVRIFTNSSNTNTLRVFNNGVGVMGLDVEGHANIASMNVVPTIQAAFAAANAASSGTTDTFARNTANAAFNQANTARDQANTALTTGQAAFGQANTALTTGQAAFGQANTALTTGQAAFGQANTALTTGQAAFGQANTALSVGQAAFGQANTSRDHANASFGQANTSRDQANAAFVQANTARTHANAAHLTANAAFDFANTRYSSSGGTITGNVNIIGNLTLSGNTTLINVSTYVVNDPLIYLAGNNYSSDIVDIGFIANYVNATGSNVHTGVFRDATTKEYYVFEGYNQEPDNNHIDPNANGFTISVLNATLRTSNIILGGVNAISWIRASYDQANTARDHANAAHLTANAGFVQANTSRDHANAGFVQANTARDHANAAFSQANTARNHANAAHLTANAAFDQANTARTVVNDTVNGTRYLMFSNGTSGTTTLNVAVGLTFVPSSNTLNINGPLNAVTKSFVIPHPTKDGMTLRYGSLEGPENGVYVRGKLEGKSIIELPEYWWNLIDQDTITVNLTPYGRSQDIWVQSTSAYFIHLNQPADCFFTVYAERKDVDKLVVEY